MINTYLVKKWAALSIGSMLSVCSFAIVATFYGFLWGIVAFLISMIISILLGNVLLKNPFTDMLEGKGLLVLNIDSTGIIKPFLVGVNSPYIEGKIDNQKIKDVFDRETVLQIAAPVKNATPAILSKDSIKIELNEENYNKARFALYHYPVLIYNKQNNTIITKDFLAETEKQTFAEHGVLYLNRIMEELTNLIRDFARYIVELTKPQLAGAWKKWIWIIIIVGIIILAVMFAPSIINAVKGTIAPAAKTAGNAISGSPIVTPQ